MVHRMDAGSPDYQMKTLYRDLRIPTPIQEKRESDLNDTSLDVI